MGIVQVNQGRRMALFEDAYTLSPLWRTPWPGFVGVSLIGRKECWRGGGDFRPRAGSGSLQQ